MKTNIFHLQIVSINDILPQETFDISRAKKLALQIKSDGQLTNPIIVAGIGKNKFIQLDGANRLQAMQLLAFNSIVCQIVDYQDMDNVELASWLHLVKINAQNILETVKSIIPLVITDGKIKQVRNRFIQSEGTEPICLLVSPDLKVKKVVFKGGLTEKVEALNKIVSVYQETIIRDVLPLQASRDDLIFLFKVHPECQTMVVFPIFTRHQIIKVIKKGGFFPAGITRHVIKKRCLNINLPLEVFGKGSVEEQNRILDQILEKRRFRLYEEPTIYFE